MSVKRVTPDEAAQLAEQGWALVDVRSVPEFEQGHPEGAYNVPLMHKGPGGMTPNPAFYDVMARRFSADSKLVLSCRSGARSLRAAEQLAERGWSNVVDMRAGFAGESQGGQVTCQGWQARGLPVATEAEAGKSYAELEKEGE